MAKGNAASTADAQRARGAYYTPDDAALFMARWVLADGGGHILEPTFGDGAFVRALRTVSSDLGVSCRVSAVELDESAFQSFKDWGEADTPILSDFHEVPSFNVDAVIGNPPFVRFRHLSTEAATRAIRAAEATTLEPPDSSGSIWMSVALHASTFLREGGRLALVLPADALYVRYARPFWQHLSRTFSELRILRTRERLFPEILQDVVLLLADGYGGSTDHVTSEVYPNRHGLANSAPRLTTEIPVESISVGSQPFTRALLGDRLGNFLEEAGPRLGTAREFLKFNIGYVAGDKTFFQPSEETIAEFGLPPEHLTPTITNGRQLTRAGLRTSSLLTEPMRYLWRPDPGSLTSGEVAYIRHGEELGVSERYKCRIRDPWFVVPGARIPDVVMPVFGSLPTLMVNDGQFVASNSLLLGYWKNDSAEALSSKGVEDFCFRWHTSITRLGVELSVHSLGGGVLVAVPKEADSVLVPRTSAGKVPEELVSAMHLALSEGDTATAYGIGDEYLHSVGWSRKHLKLASRLADALRSWREER